MNEKTTPATGGCLCGAVRYRANGKPIWVPHCHCSMCKRTSGSAFLTFVGFRHDQIEWLGEKPINQILLCVVACGEPGT